MYQDDNDSEEKLCETLLDEMFKDTIHVLTSFVIAIRGMTNDMGTAFDFPKHCKVLDQLAKDIEDAATELEGLDQEER